MNLLLSDEDLIRIELLTKRCKGICETGELLHKLFSAYLKVSVELEKADTLAWERIQRDDKSNLGTE